MKKTTIPFLLLFFVLILLQSFKPNPSILKKDGAAPGYTGSPGDTLKNCTACHGGKAVQVNNWVTSNVPADGYEPGKIYTITAINKEAGATRFGFEISPQDSFGNILGKMILLDTVVTKFVGDGKYITYTQFGIDGRDSLAWSFNWMAPKAGTGNVVFYAGFNSNLDGHKEGDKTFLSNLTLKEKIFPASVDEFSNLVSLCKIYPNPCSNLVSVQVELKELSDVKISFLNIEGREISTFLNEKQLTGNLNRSFDISRFAQGTYFINIQVNGQTQNIKLSLIR